jgi:hypothetical protein
VIVALNASESGCVCKKYKIKLGSSGNRSHEKITVF